MPDSNQMFRKSSGDTPPDFLNCDLSALSSCFLETCDLRSTAVVIFVYPGSSLETEIYKYKLT